MPEGISIASRFAHELMHSVPDLSFGSLCLSTFFRSFFSVCIPNCPLEHEIAMYEDVETSVTE